MKKKVLITIGALLVFAAMIVPTAILVLADNGGSLDFEIVELTTEEKIRQSHAQVFGTNAFITEIAEITDDRLVFWETDEVEVLSWWTGDRYVNLVVNSKEVVESDG